MRVFANGRNGERVRLDGEDELHDGNGVRGARYIAPLGEGTPVADTRPTAATGEAPATAGRTDRSRHV